MKSLFTVYKSKEWRNLVLRIGSPVLISFYGVYVVTFYFSLFFAFFFVDGVSKFVNTYNKAVQLFLAS